MAIMKKETLDELLSLITESIDSTTAVVEKLEDKFNPDKDGSEKYPELIKNLIKTLGNSDDSSSNALDSVSLLSLKNSSLLGYITDLALLLATRLDSIKKEKKASAYEQDKEQLLNSIATNRVVLEKGVKSLEKKINYQLEKMVNAYHRREKEQEDLKKKMEEEGKDGSEEGSEDSEEDSEGEQEEGLNFKPNPAALLSNGKGSRQQSTGKTQDEDDEEENEEEDGQRSKDKSKEKYKPPKIAATAINDPDKEVKNRKQRNLQSMDEYLRDISDAPSVEKSIGSTIINNGRDVKSKKQMEKEAEIQRFEEENFTRLPATKTKENKRDRAKRMRNEFFGEDWSMFDNNMNTSGGNDGNAKKRKRISAWERAKRKIDD